MCFKLRTKWRNKGLRCIVNLNCVCLQKVSKNFEISFCFPMCILSKHQQNVLQTPWGSTHSLSRLPLRRPINTKEHSDFVKNGSLLSWFKPPDTIFRESTSSTKRLPPKKGEQFFQTTLGAVNKRRRNFFGYFWYLMSEFWPWFT